MPLLLKGILLGLSLSFMIGPLLFAIIQASLERGFRAGLAVGIGIWISDVVFLFGIYLGLEWVAALTDATHFKFYAGLIGGIVLLSFGLGSLFFTHKNKDFGALENRKTPGDKILDKLDGPEPSDVRHNWQTLGLWGYGLRGFFLNLFNPFTVFFWIGIASALVLPSNWTTSEIALFFGGMMLTLVAADTLKAFGAKKIKAYLSAGQIFKTQTAIGIILMGIGGFVLFKTFFGVW